jgi:excisionase family DNA binding protein
LEVTTYITVKDAAEIFRKHEKTIYRWIEEGKLKAKKDPAAMDG